MGDVQSATVQMRASQVDAANAVVSPGRGKAAAAAKTEAAAASNRASAACKRDVSSDMTENAAAPSAPYVASAAIRESKAELPSQVIIDQHHEILPSRAEPDMSYAPGYPMPPKRPQNAPYRAIARRDYGEANLTSEALNTPVMQDVSRDNPLIAFSSCLRMGESGNCALVLPALDAAGIIMARPRLTDTTPISPDADGTAQDHGASLLCPRPAAR